MKVRPLEFSAKKDPESLELSTGPGPEPEPPDDAPRVTVMFAPPPLVEGGKAGAPREYDFVVAEPNLALAMERTVRAIYVLYGSAGLASFWQQLPVARHTGGAPAGGQREWSEDDSAVALRDEFTKQSEVLYNRTEPALEIIRRTATAVALERVLEARRVLDGERQRYVLGGALVGRPEEQTLKGKGLDGLVVVLIAIDASRRAVRASQQRLRREEMTARRREVNEGRLYGLVGIGKRPRYSNAMGRDLRTLIHANPIKVANDDVLQHQTSFLTWVDGMASRYPVLHRIWSAKEIEEVIDEALRRKEDPALALKRSTALRNLVISALATTKAASDRVMLQVKKPEFDPWRYPPLVDEALRRLGVPPVTVEGQAADEKVAAADSHWISDLSATCSNFEMAASTLGMAPPILITAATVNLLLGAADWFRETWRDEEDRDAFNCSFNPAESFAAEPSSTIWSVVALALLLLQAADFALLVV
ncbi:MAG: hypothetical protein Q8M19_09705 [Reyranella sp.]|nr:hypothetical protein [Reyranella sp.]